MNTHRNRRRPLLRWRYLLVALTAVAAYLGCPFRLEVVRGDSMKPTLRDGAVCVLDRSYYATHRMARGDVIAFEMDGSVYTKRVYGAPGESIDLVRYPSDGSYGLPDPKITRYLRRMPLLTPHAISKWTPFLTTLAIPPGKCFVVGDNTEVSYDSRSFGLVDAEQVVGKMVAPAAR